MVRRVEWSAEAGRDFDYATGYIALDGETASRLVATRIFETVERLAELPAGHPGRVKGTYEKLVQKTSYMIAYSVTDRTVSILRIIHAERDWPTDVRTADWS